MRLPYYEVDAFASSVFTGNPAGVCLLEQWMDDATLQGIATENNLSETAFLVRNSRGYDLRWFTPTTEVDLCGHATLASAFVILNCLGWREKDITFDTRKSGRLTVMCEGDLYLMDFPSRPPSPAKCDVELRGAFGKQPLEAYVSAEDVLLVFGSEEEIRRLKPNLAELVKIDCRGVIVTAPGLKYDFVSRFFAPRVGVPEDPVTGSAHCVLIPYWARRLGKAHLRAYQCSKRGGEVICVDRGNRVSIGGKAVIYLQGTINI